MNQNINKQHGFTLLELVAIVVLLGILSYVAMPRMFNSTQFELRGYYDQLIQATRYAQKLAVASSCDVRVVITANNFSLEQPPTWCNTAAATWTKIALPGSNIVTYTVPNSVTATAANIRFYSSGLADGNYNITVTDGASNRTFNVFASTGYVQ